MPNEPKTALTIRAPLEVATYEEIAEQVRQMTEFYKNLMTKDTDYGVIPGTKKPTLYKPGAELLANWAGLIPEFETDRDGTIFDIDKPVYRAHSICRLFKMMPESERRYMGMGEGTCTSLESRYRWRWAYGNELPEGTDKSKLPTKTFRSSSGSAYLKYRLDNDNPHDVENTVVKIAEKRAYVDAVLRCTGASRIFTQDIGDKDDQGDGDDIVEGEFTEVGTTREKKSKAKAPKAKSTGAGSQKTGSTPPDDQSQNSQKAGSTPPDDGFREMDLNAFWGVARKITGKKKPEEILKQLEIQKIEQWTGTWEEACQKLANLNNIEDWQKL